MQKRTNPLALKGERAETDIRQETSVKVAATAPSPKKVTEHAPKQQPAVAPVIRTDKPVSAPAKPGDFSTAKSVKTASGATITYSATSKGVVATRVETVEPEPMDNWMDDVAVEEPEVLEEDILVDEEVVTEEVVEVAQENTPVASDFIEDEEEFPTLDDFKMSVRFSIRGKNSRKLILGKVSRDVLRLAQLLHPDEKISTIVENALLTRIFLENPEAFDAMAVVIEENGGRIKC